MGTQRDQSPEVIWERQLEAYPTIESTKLEPQHQRHNKYQLVMSAMLKDTALRPRVLQGLAFGLLAFICMLVWANQRTKRIGTTGDSAIVCYQEDFSIDVVGNNPGISPEYQFLLLQPTVPNGVEFLHRELLPDERDGANEVVRFYFRSNRKGQHDIVFKRSKSNLDSMKTPRTEALIHRVVEIVVE